MIPFFQIASVTVGPITLYVWGFMVALGLLSATAVFRFLTKRYVLSPVIATDMSLWALLGGFVGARLSHVLLYEPVFYYTHPGEIIKIWHGGLSSFGGFVGAVAAVRIFMALRRITWREFLPYADLATTSLWLGWGIGRIGCFLIHDHPGTLTSFIGGVAYPSFVNASGVWVQHPIRHDLGLYESLLGFALFIVAWFLLPRLIRKRLGLTAAITWLMYAAARFLLDFLRATDLPNSDLRYWQLTPAQWGMIGVMVILTGSLLYATLKPKTNSKTTFGEVA